MPSMQEMLVSYAVKIDESGVTRLHTLLDQNRKKATEAAAAFDAAEKAVASLGKTLGEVLKRFPQSGGLLSQYLRGGTSSTLPSLPLPASESTTTDTGRREREFTRFASVLSETLRQSTRSVTRTNTYTTGSDASGTVSLQADISPVLAAADQAARLLQSKAPTLRMRGDATNLISTASSAASRVKNLLSDLSVNLPGDNSPAFSTPTRMLSTGGRFASPTSAQLAEDGDPEYVIPVRKDKRAVPLITRMLGELSSNAYRSVVSHLHPSPSHEAPSTLVNPSPSREAPSTLGPSTLVNPLALSPWPLTLAQSAPTIHNHYDVSAPCTIQVHSTGSDARMVGETAYDAAERHLLKSLSGVLK